MTHGDTFEAPTGDLRIRLTHDYVGTFAEEDAWRDVGSFTLVAKRDLPLPEDADAADLPTQAMTVVVEAAEGQGDDDVRRAIEDSFTLRGCHHEHDCCGCVSHGVDNVAHLRGPFWSFEVGRSRNV